MNFIQIFRTNMSNNVPSPLLFQDSLRDGEPPQEIQRDTFDIGQFKQGAIDAFICGGTTTVTNSLVNRENDTDDGTLDLSIPTGNRLPRNRLHFSNHRLLATSELFLEGEAANAVLFMLQGIIVECPNKNKPGNLGRFRIDWLQTLPPDFDRSLLREWFPSTPTMRRKLQETISRFHIDSSNPLLETVEKNNPLEVEPEHLPEETMPSPLARRAQRALLITAADQNTVSKLIVHHFNDGRKAL